MNSKPKALICDLDGTLSNASHRVHFIERRPKDWNSFFKGQIKDPVNQWCLDLIQEKANEGVKILFVTARPENQSRSTIEWLHQKTSFKVEIGQNLFMRPNGDRREDVIIKNKIYEDLIKPHFEVVLAVDDKETIIEMWKTHGINACLCTNQGLKEPLK